LIETRMPRAKRGHPIIATAMKIREKKDSRFYIWIGTLWYQPLNKAIHRRVENLHPSWITTKIWVAATIWTRVHRHPIDWVKEEAVPTTARNLLCSPYPYSKKRLYLYADCSQLTTTD
jgi:hypothetical protein